MRGIDADRLMKKYNLYQAKKHDNATEEQRDFSYSTMMMYEIADMIESAPTVEHSDHWIPCKERLPEEKINPITRDFYEYTVTADFWGVRMIRHYKFGKGHWWNWSDIVDDRVLAWMPLPKVYEEGEKNE